MSMTAPSTATSSGCERSSGWSIPNSTRSRLCMASDTATAKADTAHADGADRRARPRGKRSSRLGGFILALNLLSLLILLGGALALNEWTRGLIEARQETLTSQAELLVRVL